MNNNPNWLATGMGTIALMIWAIGSVLIASIGKLPIFEIQIFIFLSSFTLSFCRISFSGTWNLILEVPKKMWFIGVVGIGMSSLCFISAFYFAPAEKVVLINYLWPVLVVLGSPLLLKERLRLIQVLGILTAFYGVLILLSDGKGLTGFDMTHWRGYALAFLNACFWSFYLLLSKKVNHVPKDMIGMYCGIAGIVAIVAHLTFETFVWPTAKQLSLMLSLGFLSQGVAYLLWDHAIKNGHYRLLCTLTYLAPILTISLLITFNITQKSNYLWVSTILVSLGVFFMTPKTLFDRLINHRKRRVKING